MGSTGESILLVLCLAVTFLALAVGVRLVIAARRIRWHSVPLSSSNRTTKVTVIVPARNEEQDLATTLESILKQADVTLEVIVIDDHSTDRTGMIADAAARADPRVQVIHHPPLPPGWLGKSNAMRAQPKRSGMRPCRSHEHWFRCGPTANSKVEASASDSAPTSPGDGGCF